MSEVNFPGRRTCNEIAADAIVLPDPRTWLPRGDLGGRACDACIHLKGISNDAIWLYLSYCLQVCFERQYTVHMIGLPSRIYCRLRVLDTQIPTYQGCELVDSDLFQGSSDDLSLHIAAPENPEILPSMPIPEDWLPCGKLGPYPCASSIDVSGARIKTVLAFLEGAAKVCDRRGYMIDLVSVPSCLFAVLAYGIPFRPGCRTYHGAPVAVHDWEPALLRIQINFHAASSVPTSPDSVAWLSQAMTYARHV
jgi:hypothetical protein